MINRRLYLESPIQLQGLLIVPYKLGTIRVENNKQIQVTLQRAQDNNSNVSVHRKTIVIQKTIATKKTIRTGTNNNRRP